MEDINLLLTYLETEITEGKKSLLGSGVVVDGETILNLVRRLRESVNSFTGADVIASANLKAQQIVAMAEARRAEILDNDTIIADAYAISEKIKNEALEQRAKANFEFNNKLYNMLSKVNNNLKVAEEQIENSMEYVKNKTED
jgi:flagellar hook-basal body complex protein FliE